MHLCSELKCVKALETKALCCQNLIVIESYNYIWISKRLPKVRSSTTWSLATGKFPFTSKAR